MGPKSDKPPKRDFFTTYRYFRRPHGAMSAACVVHKETDDTYTIIFGLSFCDPTDMFSRKTGRGHAAERLMTNPIIIRQAENIAGAIIKYVKASWENLNNDVSEIFGVREYSNNRNVAGNFERWAGKFVEEL